ncbi:MAG: ATP-grasp domain-containing protein [Trueperaceae bacterium]|nr:MAG: ATP-grasp domain-containing protein [Trueperaceae bacterium]
MLKPITGIGSELDFLCETERECLAAYQLLRERLKDHPDVRLYETFDPSTRCDPRAVVAIESYVEGTEYSCDFVLEQGRVSILRIARKVAVEGHGFGTILAYLLPGELPDGLSVDTLASHLLAASRALGLERTLAMADLIVAAGEVYFLEVSPRLGGDCLPELVKASCGFDMLGAALDFAEGKSVEPPPLVAWKQFVGLRLFASCQGEIKRIDTGELLADQRVLRLELKRQAGHKVVLPPSDYGSHLLGHLFFKPHSVLDLETECLELAGRLRVEYA